MCHGSVCLHSEVDWSHTNWWTANLAVTYRQKAGSIVTNHDSRSQDVDVKRQLSQPHHYMNADGTCHAGDLFESGAPFVALYTTDELAGAWDMGHRDVCTDCNCPPQLNPYR